MPVSFEVKCWGTKNSKMNDPKAWVVVPEVGAFSAQLSTNWVRKSIAHPQLCCSWSFEFCAPHFQYLEELKDELQKLNKHDKDDSDLEFLQFVYATWPPKKKDCTMEDPKKIKESGEWKKALQVQPSNPLYNVHSGLPFVPVSRCRIWSVRCSRPKHQTSTTSLWVLQNCAPRAKNEGVSTSQRTISFPQTF